MDDVTKRNFLALSEGLKEQRTVNSEQTKRITSLENQLAQMNQQFLIVQQQLAVLTVIQQGHGATVK